MQSLPHDWQLDLAADDASAYAALAYDAIWNGYGIADLVPPYRAYTQFAVARRATDGALATSIIVRHPVFNALIPAGNVDGVEALLTGVALPITAMVMVQKPLLAVVERFFHFPNPLNDMMRMQIDSATFRPVKDWHTMAVRMTMVDLPDLQAFYAAHGGQHFNADQLASGPFFAVRQDGRIVAGGGTHAMAVPYGIAAIGNILTDPRMRGRGFASAITSAVTATLLREGCATVILNVVANNDPARRIYQRLGYRDYCAFGEQIGERR